MLVLNNNTFDPSKLVMGSLLKEKSASVNINIFDL